MKVEVRFKSNGNARSCPKSWRLRCSNFKSDTLGRLTVAQVILRHREHIRVTCTEYKIHPMRRSKTPEQSEENHPSTAPSYHRVKFVESLSSDHSLAYSKQSL